VASAEPDRGAGHGGSASQGPLSTTRSIAHILFRGGRGPARDIVALQVAKDVGTTRQEVLSAASSCRSNPSPTPSLECGHPCTGRQVAFIEVPARVRRRWPVRQLWRQRPGGHVRHLHVAQPAADLHVPGQWPVSLLVLPQAVLEEAGEGGWWRFFVLGEVGEG
jgi:hypothetical protein